MCKSIDTVNTTTTLADMITIDIDLWLASMWGGSWALADHSVFPEAEKLWLKLQYEIEGFITALVFLELPTPIFDEILDSTRFLWQIALTRWSRSPC